MTRFAIGFVAGVATATAVLLIAVARSLSQVEGGR